jgi:ParB/RepB/Spo0J family partition protein
MATTTTPGSSSDGNAPTSVTSCSLAPKTGLPLGSELVDTRLIQFGDHFRGTHISESTDGLSIPSIEISDLLESIREHGIIDPVVVWADPELANTPFKYRLVDGCRRLCSARKIRETDNHDTVLIPARIDDIDTREEAKQRGLLKNLSAKRLSREEVAMAFNHYLNEGWSQEKIAAAFGVSKSTVGRYVAAIRNASKEVKAALARGDIDLAVVLGFQGLSHDKQLEKLQELLRARLDSPEAYERVWGKIRGAAGGNKLLPPGKVQKLRKAAHSFVAKHGEDPQMTDYVTRANIAMEVLDLVKRDREDEDIVLFGYELPASTN